MSHSLGWGRPLAAALLAGALLALQASGAAARMYKYVDKAGTLHVVDHPGKVPAEYRDQIDAPLDPREMPPEEPRESDSITVRGIGSPAAPPREDEQENPGQKKKIACQNDIARIQSRIERLKQQYQEWDQREESKGGTNAGSMAATDINASSDSYMCVGPSISACKRERKKRLESERAARDERNPHKKQLDSTQSQLERTKRECNL